MDVGESTVGTMAEVKVDSRLFYRNKKVFITGHTGFKGTWLSHLLLSMGAEVIGYALEAPTAPSLFVQTNLKEKISSIIGDIRNREKLLHAMAETKPEIVLHLAAQPLVRRSYHEPALTYEINIMGTVNILEAVRLTPSVKSFVNVTTDKVYENKEWYWAYRETENLCGFDPYSNSKSCSEMVTYSYRNSFFDKKDAPAISTARSGNVIGGGDYAEDRIIPDCIRAMEMGVPITIRNPHSIRPYQHVLECLYGYLLLTERQYGNKAIEGAYNFGPYDECSVSTGALADLFCNAWGGGAAWKAQGDGGHHEANFLKLDSSKSKAVLCWEPRWDIKTAVEKTVEFAKSNIAKEDYINVQIEEYFGVP